MTGHIYWDVILEQHVRLFRGTMGAEFLFMDDNARPHRVNIVGECLQSEDITQVEVGGVAIYRKDLSALRKFHRAKWYCHLYGAQANDRRASCNDEFRGPRSGYFRQVA
ncbi:transposable element Tcb1 transposase [Trichonephila clavipes]|nr:transposable element Tcb1 transposase [Trichonephila clavipes]